MNEIEKYYNELLTFLNKIIIWFFLIPIFIAWKNWRYLNKPLKFFHWHLVSMFCIEILLQLFIWSATAHKNFWKPILKKFDIHNVNFLNILPMLIILTLVGWFYYLVLKKYQSATWLKYLIIFLCIFEVYNHFYIDGYKDYGVVAPIISDGFLIILPCIYLWFASNHPSDLPITKNAYFWISISLFLPHLVGLLFTSFSADKIYNDNFVLFIKLYISKNILTIITQFAFAYAFYLSKYVKYLR